MCFIWQHIIRMFKMIIMMMNFVMVMLLMVMVMMMISWLKRYLQQNNNWNMFLEKNLSMNICSTGINNLANVKYVNPFWKNVLDAWTEFNQKLSPVTVSAIISQPLWHNHLIKFVFIKQWQNKRLCFLADLLNNDVSTCIMSIEDLKVRYGIRGTLIDYYRLVKSIHASCMVKQNSW
jgi:hypothetical protein